MPARKHSLRPVRVPFYRRLESIRGTSAFRRFGAVDVLRALGWVCLVVAIMRPQWLEPPIEKTIPTRDVLLLVDISASMNHEDFTDEGGLPTNRLVAVQQVVEEFVEKREGDRVGLIVFGNAPFVQVPLTTDLPLCNQLLNETVVGMAGPKTSIGDALGLGISLLQDSKSPDKTMILLTDGNDTASALPPVEASRVARDRDIRVHTIAVGNPESVGEEKIDEDTLRAVAENTGGKSYLALDREQLANIYEELDGLETSEIQTVSHQPRSDLFYWPAGISFGCLVLAALVKLIDVSRSSQRASSVSVRLKVNSRTFELEAIES